MKLLFIINQFYKGGAESSLLNLLKKLDNTKHNIDLLILNQLPVENGVSLIEKLPTYVNVFDAYAKNKKFKLINKVKSRLTLTPEQKSEATLGAYKFVRNNVYDWAFHVGEWWTPKFLAEEVTAKHKAVWIHTDLTRAVTFDEEKFFSFDDCIDKYIFVSKLSLESCMGAYPFLREKSECIYNILDTENVKDLSEKPITEDYFDRGLPVIVTCANLRKEKNHLRQLNAMAKLKARGVDFIWVNVGATSEIQRRDDLLKRAKDFGLEDRFIIAGPRDNPYPYMKRASAVAVLSDYESWSMVITEAKILGTPVIATKTSGALEQIIDSETGVLADFSEEDIADKIEAFLLSDGLQAKIRENTKNCDNTNGILENFDKLLGSEIPDSKKDILYIIDDVNYTSGAHAATRLQIKELIKRGACVTVFSKKAPTVSMRSDLLGVKFLTWRDIPENNLFFRRIFDCMFDKRLTKEERKFKKQLTYSVKKDPDRDVFSEMVLPKSSKLFSEYKTVCVMSEASTFRAAVASSSVERKIQWIHTDYCEWKNKSDWTRSVTCRDSEIYSKFDRIILLTENIRESFVSLYPSLRSKAVVNKNLMPVDKITDMGRREKTDGAKVKLVTVSRIDKFKGFDRIYRALERLYAEGYRVDWTVVGDGDALKEYKLLYSKSPFGKDVKFIGEQPNPFVFVKDADVFALFSQYEGIPNTIYEAFILGVPVIATNVGGISTQVTPGENGWLTENSEDAIYEGIKHLFEAPAEILKYKDNLKNYRYDNDAVMSVNEEIFLG